MTAALPSFTRTFPRSKARRGCPPCSTPTLARAPGTKPHPWGTAGREGTCSGTVSGCGRAEAAGEDSKAGSGRRNQQASGEPPFCSQTLCQPQPDPKRCPRRGWHWDVPLKRGCARDKPPGARPDVPACAHQPHARAVWVLPSAPLGNGGFCGVPLAVSAVCCPSGTLSLPVPSPADPTRGDGVLPRTVSWGHSWERSVGGTEGVPEP